MSSSTNNALEALNPADREQRLKQFLTCPVCSYDGNPEEGGGFRFLEDVTIFRPTLGVHHNLIKIYGVSGTEDGLDDGTNWRIQCRRTRPRFCGHEWAVPDWVHEFMDWVE